MRVMIAAAFCLFACARGGERVDDAAPTCGSITCSTPPPNECADADNLIVYETPGTCDRSECSYASSMTPCPDGCDNGACNGDPCIGVTCNMPPAKYCVDADSLRVYDTGSCADGTCSYASHDEFCAFGCVNGVCNGDPCIGVTCNTPPAPHCSAANTKRVYLSPGTCSGGTCSYTFTDQNCPYGCTGGVCLDCMTDGNCVSGKWCNGGTCTTCNSNAHCGASCANCSATGDYCTGTACVDCLVDSQCGGGNYCNANSCATCNVAAHCGPSCTACSASTPMCNGSGCVCTSTSCGSYKQCTSGACVECNTVSACGANCTACGGSTPYCLDEGTTSRCVECLSTAQCTGGKTCSNGTCVSGCPAPAAACSATGSQDGSCSGAYTITRQAAQAGFHIDDNYGLCNRTSNFGNITSCESGTNDGSDAAYRIFMKTGESMQLALTRGSSTCTIGWNGTVSLKIYGTACSADCSTCANTCATNHYCLQSNTQSTTFVAPASGWYDVVVDSRGGSTADTGGVFDLMVTLTCTGGCTCP
ncbi:MAG TPA: hypothetical protein VIV11_41785 [Kofleriaceae bacterium]